MQGKKVTCKKAEARQGKIYVGKLPAGEALSKEDLQAHFEQFGSVVEVVRPVDKMKNNEPKTFAFITFAREDAAKQLVKQVRSKEQPYIMSVQLYHFFFLRVKQPSTEKLSRSRK